MASIGRRRNPLLPFLQYALLLVLRPCWKYRIKKSCSKVNINWISHQFLWINGEYISLIASSFYQFISHETSSAYAVRIIFIYWYKSSSLLHDLLLVYFVDDLLSTYCVLNIRKKLCVWVHWIRLDKTFQSELDFRCCKKILIFVPYKLYV